MRKRCSSKGCVDFSRSDFINWFKSRRKIFSLVNNLNIQVKSEPLTCLCSLRGKNSHSVEFPFLLLRCFTLRSSQAWEKTKVV